jgi:hypothetical protein
LGGWGLAHRDIFNEGMPLTVFFFSVVFAIGLSLELGCDAHFRYLNVFLFGLHKKSEVVFV